MPLTTSPPPTRTDETPTTKVTPTPTSAPPSTPSAPAKRSPPPSPNQPSSHQKTPAPSLVPASPAPAQSAPSPAPTGPAHDADPSEPPDGDIIDEDTFNQILDLDEDDTHDFSKGMAWAYFSQAATTFVEMEEALAAKELLRLSELGHFLKGSSAALGVSRVQASCERIQHYGKLRDDERDLDLTPAVALAKIATTLARVRDEYAVAERWLRGWYADNGGADSPPP